MLYTEIFFKAGVLHTKENIYLVVGTPIVGLLWGIAVMWLNVWLNSRFFTCFASTQPPSFLLWLFFTLKIIIWLLMLFPLMSLAVNPGFVALGILSGLVWIQIRFSPKPDTKMETEVDPETSLP